MVPTCQEPSREPHMNCTVIHSSEQATLHPRSHDHDLNLKKPGPMAHTLNYNTVP